MVATLFVIFCFAFLGGVIWAVVRLAHLGNRAIKGGARNAAAARGDMVPGTGWGFGDVDGIWVDAHPFAQCPPEAPRHGSDNLCEMCSWAHAAGVNGPWNNWTGGRALVPMQEWRDYIDRVLDATASRWLDYSHDGWGVPRVLPGGYGWDAEAAWLRTVQANGDRAYWPSYDVYGNPLQ